MAILSTKTLTTQAIEAQARADVLAARDRALADLLELLYGDGGLSLWRIAGDLADRLRRFKGTAWPRIQAGYREPRDRLEEALVAIMRAGCPGSQRRVYQFSTIAAQAGNIAARVRVNSTLSDIRPMVSQVELSDYRAVEWPTLETHEIEALGQPEGRQLTLLAVTASVEDLQITESVQNLVFSRELLVNMDFNVILTAAEAAGAAAGRQLGVKLAALLEDNSNLGDGTALFASAEGNDRTDGGLDLTKLDLTANSLRQIQTPDGGYSNGRPRFILVPSTKEMAARVLAASVNEALSEDQHLRVVALPWLSPSYWYLAADPADAPSIAMATLAGGNGDIVRFEELPRPSYRNYSGDGAGFRVRTAVGLSAVGRNIVRNTLA